MANLQVKRNIKFVTVEREDAFVVLAALVEIRNGIAVPVSEPKIVKIIPKAKEILALPVASKLLVARITLILYPYFDRVFFSSLNNIIWFFALPPTFSI